MNLNLLALCLLFHTSTSTIYDFGYFGNIPYLPIAQMSVAEANSELMTGGDQIRIVATLEDYCNDSFTRTTAVPFFSGKNLLGLFGIDCSATVVTLAPVLPLPLLSHAATSPLIQNQTLYPMFFPLMHVDSNFEYLLSLAQMKSWERIAIFSVVDSLTQYTRRSLERFLGDRAVFVSELPRTATSADYSAEIRKAKDMHLRIFIYLHWQATQILQFLKAVAAEGTYGSGYALVLNDVADFDGTWTTPTQAIATNMSEIKPQIEAIQGALGIQPKITVPVWFEERMVTLGLERTDIFPGFTHDSVTAAAIAIERCKTLNLDVSSCFKSQLREVVFVGVTGDKDLSAASPPTRMILNYLSIFGKVVATVSPLAQISFSNSILWPGARVDAPTAKKIIITAIPLDLSMLSVIRQAVEDANSIGWLKDGDTFQLSNVVVDRCVWNSSVASALASSSAIISCNCSPTTTLALADITDIPIMEICSTAVALRDAEKFPNFIRLCPADDVALEPVVQFLNSLGVRRVAVLYESRYDYVINLLQILLDKNGIVSLPYTREDTQRRERISAAEIPYIIVAQSSSSPTDWVQDGNPNPDKNVIVSAFFGIRQNFAANSRLVIFGESSSARLNGDRLSIANAYAYDAVQFISYAQSRIETGSTLLDTIRRVSYNGTFPFPLRISPGTNDRGAPVKFVATVRYGSSEKVGSEMLDVDGAPAIGLASEL